MSDEAENKFIAQIEAVGDLNDRDIDLAQTALAIAAVHDNVNSIERYENHIKKLIDQTALRYQALLKEGSTDSTALRLQALRDIIAEKHDYIGDSETYEDLQNVNLIRVIERRKGMPVSLALLYIHIGKAQGWDIVALSFPAHVICRIDFESERILFDPFHKAKEMQASDLRQMMKELIGDHMELSGHYYTPAPHRDILIRMQNNIKLRQIEAEDYEAALITIQIMQLLDPQEHRLLFDAGVLCARTHQIKAAIDNLEDYIDLTPSFDDKQEAILLLNEIKNSLN